MSIENFWSKDGRDKLDLPPEDIQDQEEFVSSVALEKTFAVYNRLFPHPLSTVDPDVFAEEAQKLGTDIVNVVGNVETGFIVPGMERTLFKGNKPESDKYVQRLPREEELARYAKNEGLPLKTITTLYGQTRDSIYRTWAYMGKSEKGIPSKQNMKGNPFARAMELDLGEKLLTAVETAKIRQL